MTKIDKKVVGYKVVTDTKGQDVSVMQDDKVVATYSPFCFNSVTRVIKTPDNKVYLTVNFENGVAKKVFLNLKDLRHYEFMASLAIAISKSEVNKELLLSLSRVQSMDSFFYKPTGFEKPKNMSLTAAIAYEILGVIDLQTGGTVPTIVQAEKAFEASSEPVASSKVCAKCGGKVIKLDGCDTCVECGESKCG